jgi:hypothetical protein
MAKTNQQSSRLLLSERESPNEGRRMKKHALWMVPLMLVLPLFALAQDDGDDGSGRTFGNYQVTQSIEFGGRVASTSGNQQMYDTFVNLKSGPRLLGQELSMRSINHEGSIFDNLYLSSFGFGGDPNDVARLRLEKNKWYNFVGLYRRDENFFDYDLFANPLTLNPGITNCSTVSGGVVRTCANAFSPQALYSYTNTPHSQDTTRNMGDFNLTLLPQSAVRFRLGFARNNNKGTVNSSLEDVDIGLTQQYQSRSDRWTFGVDVRPLARTTLSFDEIYEHDKVDVAYVNSPQNGFPLGSAAGPTAFLPLYFPPCTIGSASSPSPYITANSNGVLVLNSLCNTGVFNYFRNENVRSGFPTERLSLQSNYFRRLDITASGSYSSGDSKVLNYNELFQGLVSRTNTTAFLVTGPTKTQRISGNADLGLTYHITKKWNISDKFRWLDWRDPGVFSQSTFNCFSTLATGQTLSTPTGAPCGIPGITTTGSAPSGSTYNQLVGYNTLEAERSYFNTVRLTWDPSRRVRAYVGYRYGRRELTDAYLAVTTNFNIPAITVPVAVAPVSAPLSTNRINEHTALLGTVLRPTLNWRINADAELLSADNSFNNITPRHQQRVRANTVYKVRRWASVNGGVNFIESRNNWAQNFGGPGVNLFPTSVSPAYGTQIHSRYYSLGATLMPNRRVSVDFGWTYLDQKSNAAACMVLTGASVVAGSAPPVCPVTTNQPTVPATFNITASQFNVPVTQVYQENTNTGYANLIIHPLRRVTLNLGYQITSTTGYDNWLRADTGLPLMVLGDVFGNVPGIPGNPGTVVTGATTSAGTISFLGPFPNQPLGSQVFNWHRPYAGLAVEVIKHLTLKGSYAYYDYTEKEGNLPLAQLVALPRNFHANLGTVSLKYSF